MLYTHTYLICYDLSASCESFPIGNVSWFLFHPLKDPDSYCEGIQTREDVLGLPWNALPALATNASSPVFSWQHPEIKSCRCCHMKFGPDVLKWPVSGTDIPTRATGTHSFKHFVVLSLNETCSLAPCPRERYLSYLPAPKPKASVWGLLTINQFPTLWSFGLRIPTLHGGSRTNI